MTAEWFAGEGRNADDEASLTELRHLAGWRGLADVRPEATGTSVYSVDEDEADDGDLWVVVWLDVPGLGAGDARPQLHVRFDLSDPTLEPLVVTWETHGYLLDNWDVLDLDGDLRTPSGLAARAFAWMHEQLGRPVELATWRTWRGRTVRMWRLADTSGSICGDRAAYRLGDRRPADVTRLR